MRYLILFLFFLVGINDLYAKTKVPSINTTKLAVSLAFEENKGQIIDIKSNPRPDILYRALGGGIKFYLLKDRIVYQYDNTIYPEGYKANRDRPIKEIEKQKDLFKKIEKQIHRIDMVLIGANPDVQISHEDKSEDYTNYYQHHCPEGILYVPSYRKIIYKNIYANIDWEIYFNKEGLKYDFVVHPGGDPKDIKFRYEHADKVGLNANNGNLEIKNRLGQLIEKKPISLQNEKSIVSSFKDYGSYYGYNIAEYNPQEKLIIDPLVLAWGNLYHMVGASPMVIDKQGNTYIVTYTDISLGIASGGFQNVFAGGNYDGYIIKTDKNGYRVWTTYYGGSQSDAIVTCAIDSNDNLYVGGSTNSTSVIASGGFKNTISSGGETDAFLVKFNPNGTRIWGTYYGGTGPEIIETIAIDKSQNIYFSGATSSTNGIASGGFQNTKNGGWDAFLVKFTPSCTRIWGTYYGGNSEDLGIGCAVSTQNDVYLCGTTNSDSIIASGGFLNTRKSINTFLDAFLVKFNSNGNRLWSTYYGGGSDETHIRCVTDKYSNVYLYGETQSSSDIAFNGFQNTFGTSFLVKLDSNGLRKWATYIGDGSNDILLSARTDKNGCIYMMGSIRSLTNNLGYKGFKNIAPSSVFENGFFTKLDNNGNRIWSSYYGSNRGSAVGDCAFDKDNNLHISFGIHSRGIDTAEFDVYKKYLSNTPPDIIGGGVVKFVECDTLRDTFRKTICINDSFYFNDSFRKNNGVFNDTLKNSLGCDSFITLILTLNLYAQDSIVKIICKGQSYQGYNITGIYRDTFVSSICDSIRVLNLTILNPDTTHLYDTICSNQSYYFNNQLITTSGIYRDTFSNSRGCDSFIFLHLYVKTYSSYSYNFTTSCTNPSYYFNNQTLTQSGIYKDTLTNIYGCDSFITLNLKVVNPSSTTLFITRCPNQPYFFNGQNRTTSGTYTQILTNTQGCDSTITLNLTVLTNPASQSNTIWACTPFVFQGKTYMNNAVVKDTLKSSFGCDSVYLTHNLLLKPIPTTRPVIEHIVCDSVWIGGVKYINSFSYIDTFRTTADISCDSFYQPIKYTIKYTPNLTISSKQADTFYKGETVNLYPSQALNYLWQTGEKTRSKSFVINSDQTIYLIGWNDTECRDTAFIQLIALDLTILDFPTGFSPTGIYSENHYFKPNINGKVEKIRFDIYNRLGEKMYFSTQPNMTGWDGTYRGKDCPAEIYSYICEYTTNRRIYFKTGEVMLVR